MSDTKLQVLVAADLVDFYLQRGQLGEAAEQLEALEAAAVTYRHTARANTGTPNSPTSAGR